MALTKEKQGEIAIAILQHKFEKNGDLKLIPSEIKRVVANSSKKLKISQKETAEFFKVVFEEAFRKTVAELDEVIAGKVE